MYERWTDRARRAMSLGNQEARSLNHEYLGTEHILLGIIKEGQGVAANVLKNLDISLDTIRAEILKVVLPGLRWPTSSTSLADKLPLTPRAKQVVEVANDESRNLGHNYVGTEHVLLGLLCDPEGISAQVLSNLGVTHEIVREEILNLLGPKTDRREEGTEEVAALRTRIAEMEALFDLQWKAELKAVEMWRASGPYRDLSIPDRKKLVIFLLERIDDAEARIGHLEAKIKEWKD